MSEQVYGLLAEFDDPERVLQAAQHVYAAGYRRVDAYAPYSVPGLAEAVGMRSTKLPWFVLGGGIGGAALGYGMQYYAAVLAYPHNVGGRPFHSWPAFIPVTFEMTVLVAALVGAAAMFALNGLPQLYHPVFNAPRFKAASRDRFFLCIQAADPQFDAATTRQLLETLRPLSISDVRP